MCKKKTKKVYRFLQQERKKMIDVHIVKQKSKDSTQILTIWKKKMIDVHTVNQKKQRKNIDSYNTEEKND